MDQWQTPFNSGFGEYDHPTTHTPDTKITSLKTKVYKHKHFAVETHCERLVNTIVFLYFCCS